jgi:glycine/D-amino acid oxidase-like deaminating enzyme
LSSFRQHLKDNKLITEEAFNYDEIHFDEDHVIYNGLKTKKIIFCEGINALNNPFFRVPFLPAKGEIITIEADMQIQHIINKKIFILPVGNNLFKAGATYNWTDQSVSPTVEARNFLTHQLDTILKIPYQVVDHKAAVRPTVRDRRPITGLHPEYKQLAILNGLGTKGCLLAPLLAFRLSEKL